jgi:hypothetical protein
MTVKQYVSFLPPFVMRVTFASIGRVDVAADMFNLFPHEASQLLDRTKTNSRINRGIEYCRICLWAFRSAPNNGRDVFRLEAEQASIARR